MAPSILHSIPAQLERLNGPVDDRELAFAAAVRERFELDKWQQPYMVDIIRAFRLVDGARAYVEVGTRDKGNLAWLAHKLLPGAKMIDVDIDEFPASEEKLRSELSHIEYHRITGDSVSTATVSQVAQALGPAGADAIFCDSSHMYDHTLSEFDAYFGLLRPGGVLMYHDCFWEGTPEHKGKAQALQQIDRIIPVYCVYMDEAVHRYRPRSENSDVWGGVAIAVKSTGD